MSKARTLANLISDNSVLADGQIAVAEVTGAAPLASPTFSGNVTTTGSFIVGNASLNENDLESIDGITAGTVAASKAVVVNSNKDASGFRNISLTGTVDGVDIATRDAVLTSTTTTANAALPKAGGAMTGAITTNSTFDGRDIATDGTKLDTIATNANNYTHPNHSGEVTSSADGATVIADNVVDEANLKISNTPTNGYVLTAQSGNTGGLTWAEAASGADLYAANESSPSAQPSATGTNAIAIGDSAISSNTDSFAFGKARSRGIGSFAALIDNNTTTYGATNNRGIAIGKFASAGTGSVCIGYGSYAGGSHSYAIGEESSNQNFNSTYSFGYSIFASAANQVNIAGASQDVRISEAYTLPKVDGTASGQVLTTNGSGTVSWAAAGGGADLYAANESSPDAQPSATGANAIAIGEASVASGSDAFAVGSDTDATGTMSMALGKGAQATANYNLAIGLNANATGERAVGIGNNGVIAGSAFSTAIGTNSGFGGSVTATGAGAMALGGSRATGVDSFAAAIANNTASYGSTATGAVSMGATAKATGQNSFALGQQTVASGSLSVAHGFQGQTIGSGSFCTGSNSIAEGLSSAVIGGRYGHAKEQGKIVFGGGNYLNDGNTINLGFQAGILSVAGTTTDATTRALTSYNNTANTTNQLILPNNSAFTFTGTIIAREKASAGSDYASWEVKGTLLRDANAASTVLGVSIINKLYATSGASAWVIALSADTTNGGLKVEVTGAASTNIRWATSLHTTEVIFA